MLWASGSVIARQGRQAGAGPGAATATSLVPNGPNWPTHGGNLASQRYVALDQINKDNFKDLTLAWRFKTDRFGTGALNSTPLYVNGILYATVGSRRSVVAFDAGTAEVLWMHHEEEGPRGQAAVRRGAGRGLSYWSSADGKDQRVLYVTPGYRLIALNAKTGEFVRSFGKDGVVDLKLENDQQLDLVTAGVGLNSTPLVAGDVIVVGAAHGSAATPSFTPTAKGFVRGFDARTGKRLWIFHGVPLKGEFGYDTWKDGSAERNGNLGAWAEMSADLELGLVYVPTEMAATDYYGVNRPGDGLFGESIVALDLKTGKRKWHYQTIHHGLWDWDLPCAPMLYDTMVNGRRVKVLAQPTKSAFLFVLNRETGAPIWPIEERPVPQSNVPGEKTSPTQPFPTKPLPFDRQGVSIDDLIDFTPELRAQAVERVKRYKLGPIFTPPALAGPDAAIATLMLPTSVGGANWPGGSLDPETNRLYVHSHTDVFPLANVQPEFAERRPGNEGGLLREGAVSTSSGGEDEGDAGGGRGGRGAGGGGGAGGRGGLPIEGLPLIKPPYDRITAFDMNTGDMLWQKAHGTTPDSIKNHPALKGLNLPRLGTAGRIFLGVLATKTLLIAGEGGVHANASGTPVALLRAYDKATGEDVPGIEMPGRQTGSPMTYMHNGKQYIVLAAAASGGGGEFLAYALR